MAKNTKKSEGFFNSNIFELKSFISIDFFEVFYKIVAYLIFIGEAILAVMFLISFFTKELDTLFILATIAAGAIYFLIFRLIIERIVVLFKIEKNTLKK